MKFEENPVVDRVKKVRKIGKNYSEKITLIAVLNELGAIGY
ncbi:MULTISPECIES: hypothetical protein [unclassified Paraburkholderia]|nr:MULTISPECIES: hypothetical protein [unclassified Paraburkholderia]